MSEQLSFDGFEPLKPEQSTRRSIPEFPSAVEAIRNTEQIPPSEAHLHDLGTTALSPEEEIDIERTDSQAQGNFTMLNVKAGVEAVTFHKPSRNIKHPHSKSPRQQGKARWYVLGEKRHPEEYSRTDDEGSEEIHL